MCSLGAELATERLRIVGELWQAGVRADMAQGEHADLSSQMEHAELLGVPHVLILEGQAADGAGSGAEQPTTVRATLRHLRSHQQEEEVPASGTEVAKLLAIYRRNSKRKTGEATSVRATM